MSHVVLTWPALELEFKETLRMMAVAMVTRPTAKTMPMLIFSTREIFRFQSTRIGTAITITVSQAPVRQECGRIT